MPPGELNVFLCHGITISLAQKWSERVQADLAFVTPLARLVLRRCPAVIKCSEVAPNVAALYQRLIAQYLDPSAYVVVTGEVDVINRLLEEPWGQ